MLLNYSLKNNLLLNKCQKIIININPLISIILINQFQDN